MSALVAAAAAAFVAALAFVLAVWLGYPLVLLACGAWRAHATRSRPRSPVAPAAGPAATLPPLPAPPAPAGFVSLIIAAHNEAAVIPARLANLAALDYPRDQVEVIVVEDGSVDGTAAAAAAAAAALAEHCPPLRVRVLSAPERQGKAAALNRAVAAAAGTILVFSDANNGFAADALRRLLAPLQDTRVGAVAGWKTVAADCGVGGGESVYWRFERWLMEREDRLGWVVNAAGEVLAMRRECFRPLPMGAVLNDDLFFALSVRAQGRRVAFAPAARSFEPPAANGGEEWRRRRRIAAGRWRALRATAGERRARGPGWSLGPRLALLAHQVLRPWSAWAMALALPAGVAYGAAAPGWRQLDLWGRWLWLAAAAQGAFYAWALLVAAARSAGWRLGRWEAPWFFLSAQAAAAAGIAAAGRGGGGVWSKPPRATPFRPTPATGASGARAPRDPAIDRQAVAGNLAWAALSFALGKLAALASLILLARLLTPRAFGAVTIVLTAVTFLEVAGRVGLNTALIYQPADAGADGIAPAADAVFWFWMATACLEAVAAWLGAPAVAAFFRQPLVTPMLRVMAPALLVTALGATHDTLLRRALRFRKKLAPDLGLALAKAGASVALALAHWGAWSLIGGQWAGAVAGTALLWWVVPWRPRRRWAPLLARQLLAYGKHIYALDLSGIVLANLDYLVVARMLGATALGFYYLAFRLPEALLISVLNVITGVVFPAFSRLHADPPRLRAAVLETERYAVLFALPMAAALALLARPLVLAFYGRHWLPAVPVLQVLALYAAIRCLSHHFGDAYKALGKPQILSALTVVWWLLLPPALVLGARWDGLVGVAWGQVATRAAMTAVHFVLIVRVVGIAPGRLARALAPALEGTLALAMAILAVRPLAAPLPAWPALLLPAGAGAAAYGLLLWLRHREVCLGAWLVTRELLARRGIRVAGSGHASA